MPFAPIMRRETATQWLDIPHNAWTAMEWMTITVQAKTNLIQRCPAVVHVDGTLRPQLIAQDTHPVLWNLLKNHEQTTGEPALINTSFNRHEQPICCTAEDAVNAFIESKLDALWLGNTWIERKLDNLTCQVYTIEQGSFYALPNPTLCHIPHPSCWDVLVCTISLPPPYFGSRIDCFLWLMECELRPLIGRCSHPCLGTWTVI